MGDEQLETERAKRSYQLKHPRMQRRVLRQGSCSSKPKTGRTHRIQKEVWNVQLNHICKAQGLKEEFDYQV